MIGVEGTTKAADNAGAVVFRCIRVPGGHRRRYGRLGEIVYSISKIRKVYPADTDKKILAKKVKKKRGNMKQVTTAHKRREKKKRKDRVKSDKVKPYLTLLTALKKSTNRNDGSYIKFDENRSFTFTEPTKFGPAGKSTMIPNFLGTRVFGPCPIEIQSTE